MTDRKSPVCLIKQAQAKTIKAINARKLAAKQATIPTSIVDLEKHHYERLIKSYKEGLYDVNN